MCLNSSSKKIREKCEEQTLGRKKKSKHLVDVISNDKMASELKTLY